MLDFLALFIAAQTECHRKDLLELSTEAGPSFEPAGLAQPTGWPQSSSLPHSELGPTELATTLIRQAL